MIGYYVKTMKVINELKVASMIIVKFEPGLTHPKS